MTRPVEAAHSPFLPGRARACSKPSAILRVSGEDELPLTDYHPAVTIVVPTLREAPNLEPLAERVAGALVGRGLAWEMLLVDDDSDDDTLDVAGRLARRLPLRIEVRRGNRPDLSQAVLQGIAHARYDRVVVMDADLSHPPERIPDLLAGLAAGCDMVVGTRYAAGASTAGDWGLARVLNSRFATLLAAPMTACSDPMAGFFAVDRRALPDRAALRPVGYKIGLELMVRGRLRVGEVPIAFDDRHRGKSKLGWRQRLDYLRHLGRLYLHVFAGRSTRRSGPQHAGRQRAPADRSAPPPPIRGTRDSRPSSP